VFALLEERPLELSPCVPPIATLGQPDAALIYPSPDEEDDSENDFIPIV